MTDYAAQEQRRLHLIALMDEYGVTCAALAAMVDRRPQTVRAWRSGHNPINDHSLALVELILRMSGRKAA
jgi:hypothetical protein